MNAGTPDLVRTDELQPGDRVRHPHDWSLITVSAAPETFSPPLQFHNRATDQFESGLRVTATDASGVVGYVDVAPSYLWYREAPQPTAPVVSDAGTPGLVRRSTGTSTTRAVTALAALIHESQQRRSTATGVALDVDSAGMLMSPETAAELVVLRAGTGSCEVLREMHAAAEQENVRLRERVAELESAPLYLAEFDGMEPELHRTLDGAKEYIADGASADGQPWELLPDGNCFQMVLTDPDTDRPRWEGPGRITPMRPVAAAEPTTGGASCRPS